MTPPYIPPRKKSLRDALLAAQLEAPAPVRPDVTGTRGYEMPRNLLGIRGTNEPMPRPARTGLLDRGLSALGSALTAGEDTPAGWAKELLSPLRQGAQVASLMEDSRESFRRNQKLRGIRQGLLSLASVLPSVPVDDAARFASHVERMPVSQLSKYREFLRTPAKELADDIRQNGIREPLLLEYSVADHALRLTEGNNRLAVAEALGMSDVPVSVIRREGSFPKRSGAKAPIHLSGPRPAQRLSEQFAPSTVLKEDK